MRSLGTGVGTCLSLCLSSCGGGGSSGPVAPPVNTVATVFAVGDIAQYVHLGQVQNRDLGNTR
jgi:hypothetical protein